MKNAGSLTETSLGAEGDKNISCTATERGLNTLPPPSDTSDFLRQILPSIQPGALYVSFEKRGDHRANRHFESLDALVQHVVSLDAAGIDSYMALAIFEPHNANSGAPGRQGRYAVSATAFWLDIDCGDEKAAQMQGYADQTVAVKELTQFIKVAKLPSPVVVSSGNGLHVYWPFTPPLPALAWRGIAAKLGEVCSALGFKVDSSRTSDIASVLRPVGTQNHKNPNNPKPVKLLRGCASCPADELIEAIERAHTEHCAQRPQSHASNDDLIAAKHAFPPSSAEEVAKHCSQIRHVANLRGDVNEPLWRAMLGVAKHCEDGETYAHLWSEGHPDYNYDETQDKLDRWTPGPTTCDYFRQIRPDGCEGCSHKCKTPLQLGERPPNKDHPQWFRELYSEYAWIDKDAGIYRIEYRDFISAEKFRLAYANKTQPVAKSAGATAEVSVAKLYLTHGQRRQHRAVVTRPGEPEVTADNCLNDWAGFTIAPSPGTVEPFLELYGRIFGDEQFPLLWLAHLVQRPGIKMFVSLVVWSNVQGVGKNMLFETVGMLFNPHHYALISQSEVDDDFTGWIPAKVFVIADEVRAAKSDKSADRLKIWVTATTLHTHDKNQPKRVVDNLMNIVFLSNHADGMFMNDYDRRYAVYEARASALPNTSTQEFLAWRKAGGLAYLLHYLQNVDLGGFDPKQPAPVTGAKLAMIEANRPDLDRWAHDIVHGAIPLGKEVATAEELTARYVQDYPHARKPSAAVLSKVLIRMGARRRDNQIRLSSGRKVRALALFRPDHWEKQPESSWRQELEKHL